MRRFREVKEIRETVQRDVRELNERQYAMMYTESERPAREEQPCCLSLSMSMSRNYNESERPAREEQPCL